jgi:hypothetical protein
MVRNPFLILNRLWTLLTGWRRPRYVNDGAAGEALNSKRVPTVFGM